jgi:hypothetical protein
MHHRPNCEQSTAENGDRACDADEGPGKDLRGRFLYVRGCYDLPPRAQDFIVWHCCPPSKLIRLFGVGSGGD